MNVNRKYAAIATVITAVMLGIGAFLFSSSGSTAPKNSATAQSITAKTRDTSGAALSGVAVELTGPGNTKVTSGTTNAGGQVSLTFDADPGTYVLTAAEPTGYRAYNDKDGGATDNHGLTCSSVYLCVYLTATEMQNADGSTFMQVKLSHVRLDQVSELDDLWFELTPPSIADDETSLIDPDEEVLIGEPGNDELVGEDEDDDDDEALGESSDDDTVVDDPSIDIAAEPVGLAQFCANTQHQPIAEQNAASGIWVRGEVYGLDGGWIFVEGPTINNGQPVQIPIEGGTFDGPLGINSYGEHTFDRFEIQGPGADDAPVNLLPSLLDGPGATFPVDANEGPVFDDECFGFAPPAAAADSAEATLEAETTQAMQSAEARVDAFLNDFVANHTNSNTAELLDTLHPAIPLAFGEDTCHEYVARTTGSITGATVVDVQLPQTIEMDSPNGPITFPEAVPFTVEFELVDGTTVINEANLALHDGDSHWLTRCGN